jgi:hypothetical protein
MIARALAKIGDFKGALELARTLAALETDKTDKPLPPTFSGFVWRERALCLVGVADLLLTAGQREDARSALRQAESAYGSKEDRDQVDVLLALASAQLKVGDGEGALRSWIRATQYVKTPEGWSSLVELPHEDALSRFALERARARDYTWALQTAAAIQGKRLGESLRWRAFADIAVIQAESGDPKAAQVTAQLIPESGRFEVLPAWEAIAKAHSKSQDARATAQWASGLTPVSFKASALLGIAQGSLPTPGTTREAALNVDHRGQGNDPR